MTQSSEVAQVLDFCFAPGMAQRWFKKEPAFDSDVRERLGALHGRAAAGALDHWRDSADGCVALVILLDQVPRNLFRGEARAFATDDAARRLAFHAIERGFDQKVPQARRIFLYLPLEHSESLEDQEACVRLAAALDEDTTWHDYALRHRDVIARFGRFPHRNAALGRESTPEEEEFLAGPDSAF